MTTRRKRRDLPITVNCRELVEEWRGKALTKWQAGEAEEAHAYNRCAEQLAEEFGFYYEPPFQA